MDVPDFREIRNECQSGAAEPAVAHLIRTPLKSVMTGSKQDVPALRKTSIDSAGFPPAVHFARGSANVSEEFLSDEEDRRRRDIARQKICAIHTDTVFVGTGFLVAPNLILTCYHVYKAAADLSQGRFDQFCAYFDHFHEGQMEQRPNVAIRRDPLVASFADRKDYVLLELEQPVEPTRGFFKLSADPLTKSMKLRILGYPASMFKSPTGQPRAMALPLMSDYGELLAYSAGKSYFSYSVDTISGCSGSPLFDRSYRVVGVHQGKQPGMQNDGIPIGAILDDLRAYKKIGLITLEESRVTGPVSPIPAARLESAAAVLEARETLIDPGPRRDYLKSLLDRDTVVREFKQRVGVSPSCMVFFGPRKAGYQYLRIRLEREAGTTLRKWVNIELPLQHRSLSSDQLLEQVNLALNDTRYDDGECLALVFRAEPEWLQAHQVSLFQFSEMVQQLLPKLAGRTPRPCRLIAAIVHQWKPPGLFDRYLFFRQEPDPQELTRQLQRLSQNGCALIPMILDPVSRDHYRGWRECDPVRQAVPNIQSTLDEDWLDEHVGAGELPYEDAVKLLDLLLPKEL